MKAQRRHELQQNVLDAELGKLVAFFRKYGTYLAWGVLIAALVALVATYSVKKAAQRRQKVRTRYDRVMSDPTMEAEDRLTELKDLVEQDRDTGVAAKAALAVGDQNALLLTIAAPLTTAAQRQAYIDEAGTYYRKAISKFSDRATVVGRARLGLARLAETRRHFDAAKTEYEMVLAMPQLRSGPLADAAERGLAALDELRAPVVMATTAPAPRGGHKDSKRDKR